MSSPQQSPRVSGEGQKSPRVSVEEQKSPRVSGEGGTSSDGEDVHETTDPETGDEEEAESTKPKSGSHSDSAGKDDSSGPGTATTDVGIGGGIAENEGEGAEEELEGEEKEPKEPPPPPPPTPPPPTPPPKKPVDKQGGTTRKPKDLAATKEEGAAVAAPSKKVGVEIEGGAEPHPSGAAGKKAVSAVASKAKTKLGLSMKKILGKVKSKGKGKKRKGKGKPGKSNFAKNLIAALIKQIAVEEGESKKTEADDIWDRLGGDTDDGAMDYSPPHRDLESDATYTTGTELTDTDEGREIIGFDDDGPIYSKMELASFISTVESSTKLAAAEIHSTRDFQSAEDKVQEFNRIYGKLLKRGAGKKDHDRDGGPPTPINLNETLKSNFLKTIVKSYLFRLVLTGTHSEDQDALIDWLRDVVDSINSHCYSEPLSGVLLLYPNHFIHVVEGSEDTLMRFMKVIADQFEPTGLDWKLEFRPGKGISVREPILFKTVNTSVLGIFQIKQRGILEGWKAEKANIAVQMTHHEVPPGGFRDKLFQFIRHSCIIAVTIFKLNPLVHPPRISDEFNIGINEAAKRRFEEAKQRRAQSLAKVLPKPPMIDYIIKKDEKRKLQLRSLREHLDYFWKIPPVILAQQTAWPIPHRFAPYD